MGQCQHVTFCCAQLQSSLVSFWFAWVSFVILSEVSPLWSYIDVPILLMACGLCEWMAVNFLSQLQIPCT